MLINIKTFPTGRSGLKRHLDVYALWFQLLYPNRVLFHYSSIFSEGKSFQLLSILPGLWIIEAVMPVLIALSDRSFYLHSLGNSQNPFSGWQPLLQFTPGRRDLWYQTRKNQHSEKKSYRVLYTLLTFSKNPDCIIFWFFLQTDFFATWNFKLT